MKVSHPSFTLKKIILAVLIVSPILPQLAYKVYTSPTCDPILADTIMDSNHLLIACNNNNLIDLREFTTDADNTTFGAILPWLDTIEQMKVHHTNNYFFTTAGATLYKGEIWPTAATSNEVTFSAHNVLTWSTFAINDSTIYVYCNAKTASIGIPSYQFFASSSVIISTYPLPFFSSFLGFLAGDVSASLLISTTDTGDSQVYDATIYTASTV